MFKLLRFRTKFQLLLFIQFNPSLDSFKVVAISNISLVITLVNREELGCKENRDIGEFSMKSESFLGREVAQLLVLTFVVALG